MSQLCLAIILSCLALTTVKGQSCGVVGTNETNFTFPALNEYTPGGHLVSTLEIFNVISTSAISNPHYKYIKALRYPTRYDLVTENIFPQFIRTERSPIVERSVNFKCEDGTVRRFNFIIPVIDFNDAPSFNSVENVQIQLPIPQGQIVSTGIVVTDVDLEYELANVNIVSSNRDFAAAVTQRFNLSHGYPSAYVYQVDFRVADDVSPGTYQTIITADDETNPVSKTIKITVLSSPTTTTSTTSTTTTTTTTTTVRTTTTEETPETEGTLPATNSTTTEETPVPEPTIPSKFNIFKLFK